MSHFSLWQASRSVEKLEKAGERKRWGSGEEKRRESLQALFLIPQSCSPAPGILYDWLMLTVYINNSHSLKYLASRDRVETCRACFAH